MTAPSFQFNEFDESIIAVADGSVMALTGPAAKGPFTPVLLASVTDLIRNFGEAITGYDVWAIAKQMIEGGAKVRFARSVHLTDVNDFATRTSVAALATIVDDTVVATGAVQTTAVTGIIFDDGDTLTIDVDAVTDTIIFSGVPATVLSANTETYIMTGGNVLEVKLNQGGVQYINFIDADFAVPAAATAQEVVDALNDGRLVNATAIVDTTAIRITSHVHGSDSYVEVLGGTANAILGFGTAEVPSAGPNTFPDIKSVSAEDLYDYLVATPMANLTPSFATPTLTLTSDVTGLTHYLGFSGDSQVASQFGWTVGAGGRTYGTDGVTGDDTLAVEAKEEGTWANGVAVTIADASNNDSESFKITIASPGLGIPAESYDNVTMATVEALVSAHWTFTDLLSVNVAPDDRPKNGAYAMASGDDGTAGLTAATMLGGLGAKTGIYAFDTIDFLDAFVPAVVDHLQQWNFVQWAEEKRVTAHLSFPTGLTPAEAVNFRSKTGAYVGDTVINSSFACMHYGDLEFVDPTSAVGATADYENAGAVGTVLTYNDTQRSGSETPPGPWLVPSGARRGRVRKALSIATDIGNDSDARDAFAAVGINWFEVNDGFVTAHGDYTLLQDLTKLTKWLHVRRLLLSIEAKVGPVMKQGSYEPNDPILWKWMYRNIKPIFTQYTRDRAILRFTLECDQNARNEAEAVLNTDDVINAGEYRARVRLVPTSPALILVFNLYVDAAGTFYAEDSTEL